MSKSHYIISTEKNIPQSWTVYVHCTVQCAVCAVTSVVNFATPTFFQSPICLGSILSHQKPNLPGLICRGFIKKSITWWSKKVMQKKCRSSKFDLSISSGCRRGGFFRCKAAHPRGARVYCLAPEKILLDTDLPSALSSWKNFHADYYKVISHIRP